MLYDAKLSQIIANQLLEEGIYVIDFFFPVVPKDKARIRVQLSEAHTKEHIDKAVAAFIKVGKRLNKIHHFVTNRQLTATFNISNFTIW